MSPFPWTQLVSLSFLLPVAFSLPVLLVFHAQIWNFHSTSQSRCINSSNNQYKRNTRIGLYKATTSSQSTNNLLVNSQHTAHLKNSDILLACCIFDTLQVNLIMFVKNVNKRVCIKLFPFTSNSCLHCWIQSCYEDLTIGHKTNMKSRTSRLWEQNQDCTPMYTS